MPTGGLEREDDWAEYLKRTQHPAEQRAKLGNKGRAGRRARWIQDPSLYSKARLKGSSYNQWLLTDAIKKETPIHEP